MCVGGKLGLAPSQQEEPGALQLLHSEKVCAGPPATGNGFCLLGLSLPLTKPSHHFPSPQPWVCLRSLLRRPQTAASQGPFSGKVQSSSPSPFWLLRGVLVGTRGFRLLEVSCLKPVPPSPRQLMIFNVGATILYITAFITCSAAVEPTSLKGTRPYNQRAAASVSMVPGAPLTVTRDWPKQGLCPWTPTAPGSCHLLSSHPNLSRSQRSQAFSLPC